jgi:hypothetical protein
MFRNLLLHCDSTFTPRKKNPETGTNFNIDNTFSFYAGIAARRSATVPNVTGGDCLLEGEATGISFLSGAFDVAASSSVEVELRILDSLPVSEEAAGRSAPGRLSPRPSGVGVARVARSLGHGAYPSAALFAAGERRRDR